MGNKECNGADFKPGWYEVSFNTGDNFPSTKSTNLCAGAVCVLPPAKKAMFSKTNTEISPWKVIRPNRKTEARINVINHILKKIPYDKTLKI